MRRVPLAAFGLALLCASVTSAGTMGNGHGTNTPVAKAHYTFCWGQWPRTSTAYFSAVITSVPSPKNPSFEAPFRSYLHKTFGIGAATQCFISLSMDGAVTGKKQQESSFVLQQKLKIVETTWAGDGSTASSLATPPTVSENAQTSPPPVTQAVTDTAKAQGQGQIEQAGQNLLNKLVPH